MIHYSGIINDIIENIGWLSNVYPIVISLLKGTMNNILVDIMNGLS